MCTYNFVCLLIFYLTLKSLFIISFLQKTNRLYALLTKLSNNKPIIDKILDKSKILQNEQRLDKYMCYILVTELLFGAKHLNGDSKPVQCVRAYEEQFKEILSDIKKEGKTENDTAGSSSTSTKQGYFCCTRLRSQYYCIRQKNGIFN